MLFFFRNIYTPHNDIKIERRKKMISKLFKGIDTWMEEKLDEQEFGTVKYWVWFILYFVWNMFYEFVVVYGIIALVLVAVFSFIKTEVIEEE